MPITAKELAERLHLSAAAVSMALNNKPGVSTSTRNMVTDAARKYGYDFTRISEKQTLNGSIYFVYYTKHGNIVADTPFFSEMLEGINIECKNAGYRLKITYLSEEDETFDRQIIELKFSDCIGIILLGTEMITDDFKPFHELKIPVVLLDNWFETIPCDSVIIDNFQGAYIAASYLMHKTKMQPGYLKSSYPLHNFSERSAGFFQAIKDHGLSSSKSVLHELTPSVDGACADMLQIIDNGTKLSFCYFADNDLLAVGAMKAFRQRNLHIPEDISIIGFDNVPVSNVIEPALTTINVPKKYMGEIAAQRLISLLKNPGQNPVKTAITTSLIKKGSVISGISLLKKGDS